MSHQYRAPDICGATPDLVGHNPFAKPGEVCNWCGKVVYQNKPQPEQDWEVRARQLEEQQCQDE